MLSYKVTLLLAASALIPCAALAQPDADGCFPQPLETVKLSGGSIEIQVSRKECRDAEDRITYAFNDAQAGRLVTLVAVSSAEIHELHAVDAEKKYCCSLMAKR